MTTTIPTTETVPGLLARHGILSRSPGATEGPSRAALAARLRDLDAARDTMRLEDESDRETLTRHAVTVTPGAGIRWGLVADRLHELDARLSAPHGERVVLRSRLPETSPCCAARLTRPLLLDHPVPASVGTWPCAACGRTYRVLTGTLDPRTGGRYLQAARVPYGAGGRRA